MKDNKLIAEFMGLEKENGLYLFTTPMDDYKTDTLYFNHSWDWLMPVVQKIESLGYVFTIQGGKAEYGEMLSEAQCFIAEDKLSSTYKAVVEFINQYNNNSFKTSSELAENC